VLTHESLHPTHESSTKELELIKSGWERAQEAVGRLCKWSGTSNPREREREREWETFYRNIEKTSRWNCQSRPVRPVHHISQTGMKAPNRLRLPTEEKTLSNDIDGLGPGHV
jgi:hypothetical protein